MRRGVPALFMLLTFITYVGNVSLFSHRHTIEGHTVYHSHLYSGSGEQPDHTHSSQQFKTIEALAMYVALTATTPLCVVAPVQTATTLTTQCEYRVVIPFLRHFSLRAPPVFM